MPLIRKWVSAETLWWSIIAENLKWFNALFFELSSTQKLYIKNKEEEEEEENKKEDLDNNKRWYVHTYTPPNEKACPMQNTCTLHMWWNDMPSLIANLDCNAGRKTKANAPML